MIYLGLQTIFTTVMFVCALCSCFGVWFCCGGCIFLFFPEATSAKALEKLKKENKTQSAKYKTLLKKTLNKEKIPLLPSGDDFGSEKQNIEDSETKKYEPQQRSGSRLSLLSKDVVDSVEKDLEETRFCFFFFIFHTTPTHAQNITHREELGTNSTPYLDARSMVDLIKIKYSDVVFGQEIGQGAQGFVLRAKWKGLKVAVKFLNPSAFAAESGDYSTFTKEFNIMFNLQV